MKRRNRWKTFVLAATLSVVAAAIWTQRYRKASHHRAIPISGGEAINVRIDVEPYLQADARWGNDTLGPSEDRIAGYGCTLCAAAMALTANGQTVDPKQLNDRLTRAGGYTNSGLLIWKSLAEVSGETFHVVVDDRPSHSVLDEELKRGNPIIAKVLYEGRIFHWVLITGKLGKNYLMHDPLGSGTPHESMGEYPDGIFTIRYLKRK